MRTTKHLNKIELDKVLDHLNENLTDFDCLMLNILVRTGMRGEELVRITYDDIDTRRRTLQVRAAKGSNDREVPLKPSILNELNKRLKDAPLFSGVKASAIKARLRKTLKRVLFRVLGEGYQDLSLHSLRASFALNIYSNAGHDILLVKELLGHKKIESTMFYVNISRLNDNKAKILKAIG